VVSSKLGDPSEIKEFMEGFQNRIPVIIVPTKYYTTPTDDIRDWGTSMVIWANHNMRAAVQAMKEVRFCSLPCLFCRSLGCSFPHAEPVLTLLLFDFTRQPQTTQTIFEQESLVDVEGKVTPVNEIFRIQVRWWTLLLCVFFRCGTNTDAFVLLCNG